MQKRRLVIGLTGTFGSGKTSAATCFRALGAKIIDSDALVRAMYKKNGPFVRKAEKALRIKKFDRKIAAKIVFSNKNARKKLERIVHPYVFESIRKQLAKWKSGVVVIEMPLLFETGFYKKTDANLVVTAAGKAIERRLLNKGFTKEEIKKRQAAQWPISKKESKADFIIKNNSNKKSLKKNVLIIFKKMINSKRRK